MGDLVFFIYLFCIKMDQIILCVSSGIDRVTFYPYFVVKDLFAFFIFLLIFSTFIFYFPDMLGGVIAMGGALLVLLVIPFSNTSEIRSTRFRPIFKFFYWLLVADFLILGWVGQKPVTDIYIFVGQVATVFYFLFFIIFIPLIGIVETKLIHH